MHQPMKGACILFDESDLPMCASPQFSEHTEAMLLEIGHDRDAVTRLKADGVIA